MRLVPILVLLSACGSPPPPVMPASSSSPLLQKPLPHIRRAAIDGLRVDSAELSGKVVVVKFFARYCRPCQWSLPAAQKLQQAHADVAVIGISQDESIGDAWYQVRRYRLGFPVVHDRGRALAGRFRVTELPMTFVADKQGQVVWVGGPGQDERQLKRAVEAARRSDIVADLEWCPRSASTVWALQLQSSTGRSWLRARFDLPVVVLQRPSLSRPCRRASPSR